MYALVVRYLRYFELVWHYMPYIIYIVAIVTLLPKSFRNMRMHTASNYKLNRVRYHRCYAPDMCCHRQVASDTDDTEFNRDSVRGVCDTVMCRSKKPRKVVKRVYPQKTSATVAAVVTNTENVLQEQNSQRIKWKGQTSQSSVQTHTHVNKMAKMFESGAGSSDTSTKLSHDTTRMDEHLTSRLGQCRGAALNRLAELLHKENVENEFPSEISSSYSHDKDEHMTPQPPQLQQQCHDNSERLIRPYVLTTCNHNTSSRMPPVAATPMEMNTAPIKSTSTSPMLRARASWLNMETSLEDIFAAIASNAESERDNLLINATAADSTLSTVTSIEDILSQRRLSRTLSAYSISDLLNDDTRTTGTTIYHPEEVVYAENFLLRPLNTA